MMKERKVEALEEELEEEREEREAEGEVARKYLEEETAAEASYEDAEANRAEGN